MSRGSEIGKVVRLWIKEMGDGFPVKEWDDDVWEDIEECICGVYIGDWDGLSIAEGVIYETELPDGCLTPLDRLRSILEAEEKLLMNAPDEKDREIAVYERILGIMEHAL